MASRAFSYFQPVHFSHQRIENMLYLFFRLKWVAFKTSDQIAFTGVLESPMKAVDSFA
jgi:hypothetical protein